MLECDMQKDLSLEKFMEGIVIYRLGLKLSDNYIVAIRTMNKIMLKLPASRPTFAPVGASAGDPVPLSDFPNIKNHFEPFKKELKNAKIKYKTPTKPYFYLHRDRDERFFERFPCLA